MTSEWSKSCLFFKYVKITYCFSFNTFTSISRSSRSSNVSSSCSNLFSKPNSFIFRIFYFSMNFIFFVLFIDDFFFKKIIKQAVIAHGPVMSHHLVIMSICCVLNIVNKIFQGFIQINRFACRNE